MNRETARIGFTGTKNAKRTTIARTKTVKTTRETPGGKCRIVLAPAASARDVVRSMYDASGARLHLIRGVRITPVGPVDRFTGETELSMAYVLFGIGTWDQLDASANSEGAGTTRRLSV